MPDPLDLLRPADFGTMAVPGADLLIAEDVHRAIKATSSERTGPPPLGAVAMRVESWLPDGMVVACSEPGRRMVAEMKAAKAAGGGDA